MVVNWFILLYYILVFYVSKSVICDMNLAYEFLSNSGSVPKDTALFCLEVLGFYGALCILILIKEDLYDESLLNRILICAGEMFLSMAVTVSLNFFYSGISLLVLTDLLYYEHKRGARMFFVVAQVLQFVLCNDSILSYFYNNIQFSAYLAGFHPMVKAWLIIVQSLMTFMNIFLFVLFVNLMIIRQNDENLRILRLNIAISHKNIQLREANAKLKDYSETIKRMTEIEERNRLAREIHDTLGHALTGIVVSAEAGKILFDAAPEEARARFDVIGDTARQGLMDVRRSIHALRPDALESHGLEAALEKMVANFRESTGAEIIYEQMAGPLRLAHDEEDTLYRIVQEGLTNAIRHGRATRIHLSIERQDRDLRICITDNGIGLQETDAATNVGLSGTDGTNIDLQNTDKVNAEPPETDLTTDDSLPNDTPTSGFGLSYMKERVEMLKGKLRFGNREDGNRGFCLEAIIPLRGVNLEEE